MHISMASCECLAALCRRTGLMAVILWPIFCTGFDCRTSVLITGRRAAYSLHRCNSSHNGPTLSYPAAPVICCGCDCACSCWAEAASGVCRYSTISDCLKYRRASASKRSATVSPKFGIKMLEKSGGDRWRPSDQPKNAKVKAACRSAQPDTNSLSGSGQDYLYLHRSVLG